jgi:hypothetical protein
MIDLGSLEDTRPTRSERLRATGIEGVAKLGSACVSMAYQSIKAVLPRRGSLNLLFAWQGRPVGIPYNDLIPV